MSFPSLPSLPSLAYNVLVCGAPGSGKSAFIERHVSGEFQRDHIPTAPGAAPRLLPFRVPFTMGHDMKTQWDGVFRFYESSDVAECKCQMYDFVIVLIDGADRQYVHGQPGTITDALPFIQASVDAHSSKNVIVCASKCDLRSRHVTRDAIASYLIQCGAVHFSIISAKAYNIISPLFTLIREKISPNATFAELDPIVPPMAA